MANYYDADISGTGMADLTGGTSVQFFLLHLTTIGPKVRELDGLPDDRIIRAGWISFGRTLNLIGATSRDYWHPPIFIDFSDQRWIPSPNQSASQILTLVATRVRWYLSPGTEGHLLVVGA